jgi:aspartyl-tRNA(Asn)/glutamyl-tRNA(Gln) amidotransferase subunit B
MNPTESNSPASISEEARSSITPNQITTIIGLEVHVQLQTEGKLFCNCSTAFGSEPNTQTCPVCTGMPGTLPVLNERALELSIKTGLALNCEIAKYTKWDRKNYFYPDLPKGYQISQFDKPICGEGYLEISDDNGAFDPKRVCLERAHLEEDAGKSMHDESNRGGKSKIDLNRTGTPLLEIVTKPDMRSAAEARAFLSELKLILTYIGVSDCNMQEGSLRCDANVNLHIDVDGQTIATPIVEVKNLNSFRGAERAIEYEAKRQLTNWKKTGDTINDAPKQTRGWDDPSQMTVLQREKEESADYRYFPDPDLIAYTTTDAQIDSIRETLGKLPSQLRKLLTDQHQIKAYDAEVMIGQGRGVVDYFLALADGCSNSKIAANWVGQEVLRYLNENSSTIEQYPINVSELTELLKRVDAKEIDQTRAKEVLEEMIKSGNDVETVISSLGIVSVGADEVVALAQQLIAENEAVIQQIKDGNGKAVGALIGKARKLNPNVNPGAVKDEILKALGV